MQVRLELRLQRWCVAQHRAVVPQGLGKGFAQARSSRILPTLPPHTHHQANYELGNFWSLW